MSSSPADRFRRVSSRFSTIVTAVPQPKWASPSPCSDWTAADIVKHIVETETDLLNRMPFAPAVTQDPLNPIEAWPIVRDRIQSARDTPSQAEHEYDGYFGPTTFAQTVDQFYSFDLVIHAWDLARATGLVEFEAIDPTEIETAYKGLAGLGDNVRQPGLFGPALEVSPSANEQTRFLAFVGRKH
jgi:uncharacterized protein (TIGR03086 family)